MGITVFLADNVPGIRKLEKALLEKEPDIHVVGEAEDEAKAMKLISSLRPQVVLTDFGIRPTGKLFARHVKSQNPGTKVLGVTELNGRYIKKELLEHFWCRRASRQERAGDEANSDIKARGSTRKSAYERDLIGSPTGKCLGGQDQ